MKPKLADVIDPKSMLMTNTRERDHNEPEHLCVLVTSAPKATIKLFQLIRQEQHAGDLNMRLRKSLDRTCQQSDLPACNALEMR